MVKRVLLVFVLIASLADCQRDAGVDRAQAVLAGFEKPSEQEFALFLKRKNWDSQAGSLREQTRANYFRRYALANALVAQNAVDPSAVAEETRDFAADLVINKYFGDYLAKIVTDDAAREFYEQKRNDYAQFKVHLARILVLRTAGQAASDIEAGLTRALDVHKAIQGGTSFRAAVEKYSDDQKTRKNRGDLGWVRSEDLAPGVATKVKSMRSGDISEPIGTREGYQIVQLLSDPQLIVPKFDEVKSRVMAELRYRAKQKEMERLLATQGQNVTASR